MSQLAEPNLVVPLVGSYNPRGVSGVTTVFTDGVDQRKINCTYEVIDNSTTGKRTPYLAKRQGVSIGGQAFGASGQTAYLVSRAPGSTGYAETDMWVFSVLTNDIRASSSSTTTTIATAAGYAPAYVDMTSVSGTENLVIQLRNASFAQTVWYSTAIATFTQITDAEFTALTVKGKMEFIDGWALALASDNYIYNSDLNSLANWTGSPNRILKQITQDVPRGLARLGEKILAFGHETAEVFVNAGKPVGSPLVAVKGLHHKVGLGTKVDVVGRTSYYAISGNKLYFVGLVGDSFGFWMFDGAQFNKISGLNIDKILSADAGDTVKQFAVRGRNGIAIGIDGPSDATQRWLMYFPDWNEWFEWNSTVFKPENEASRFFLGVNGVSPHKLYTFSGSEIFQDDGTNYAYTVQFKLPKRGQGMTRMYTAGVNGDTARSALNLGVEFSDDDYQTWSTSRNIDMTSSKKMIHRCGAYRGDRAVRLSYTGSLPVRLESFLARIE